MTMMELHGKRVKPSRSTITAKDENGKTCGMVRGLTRWSDLSDSTQSVYWKALKRSGMWCNDAFPLDRLYFDGKRGYYIFHCGYVPPYEVDRYNAKMEVLEKARENGIEVIRVASI